MVRVIGRLKKNEGSRNRDSTVCTCTFLFSKVMEKYLVPDYANVQEFLAHLGKRLGKLKKGKIVIKRSNESCNSGLSCLKLITQNQD